jgi:hypothetical protein
MQSATDMSSFGMVTGKGTQASFSGGCLTAKKRRVKEIDWDSVVEKADGIIAAAGAVAVALSALYFAPVLISILSR